MLLFWAHALRALAMSVSDVGPTGRPPTSQELYGAGRVIGYKCFDQNYEFMKCKAKDDSPTACAAEGDEVHRCVYGLFKEISAKAPKQFNLLSKCLDNEDLQPHLCKAKQEAFEGAFYAN
jgi:NADH dehydrogenase (ubiquinone) 1 alpha subcomplex subunit 8